MLDIILWTAASMYVTVTLIIGVYIAVGLWRERECTGFLQVGLLVVLGAIGLGYMISLAT